MATYNNNLFVGKVVLTFETLDSTNDYAKSLLSKSKPLEGTAIIAHTQTKGRGQIGNTWYSEPGKNLTVSVILYPNFIKAANQFGLTQAIALGVSDMLQSVLNKSISIKWPNDIYCEGKKLAGILVENTIAGQNLTDSVIGIGLNVNQSNFDGLTNAGSMILIAGKAFVLDSILDQLFSYIEKRYLQLKNGHVQLLNNNYLSHLYRLNEWHEYKINSGIIQGKILGITAYGQLEMETGDGIRVFNNKEVEMIF